MGRATIQSTTVENKIFVLSQSIFHRTVSGAQGKQKLYNGENW